MKPTLLQKLLMEYIGTTFFLYVIIATGNALAIGGALALSLLVGSVVLGGKFNNYNPAVSVMMALAGKLPLRNLVPYVLCQIAGGVTALAIHKYIK